MGVRQHTVSPTPYNPSPSQSRPLSPGLTLVGSSSRDSLTAPSPLNRCYMCGQPTPPVGAGGTTLAPFHTVGSSSPPAPPQRRTSERFIKPAIPAPQPASPMDTTSSKEWYGYVHGLQQHVLSSALSRGQYRMILINKSSHHCWRNHLIQKAHTIVEYITVNNIYREFIRIILWSEC